jgi:hypothetical protein
MHWAPHFHCFTRKHVWEIQFFITVVIINCPSIIQYLSCLSTYWRCFTLLAEILVWTVFLKNSPEMIWLCCFISLSFRYHTSSCHSLLLLLFDLVVSENKFSFICLALRALLINSISHCYSCLSHFVSFRIFQYFISLFLWRMLAWNHKQPKQWRFIQINNPAENRLHLADPHVWVSTSCSEF